MERRAAEGKANSDLKKKSLRAFHLNREDLGKNLKSTGDQQGGRNRNSECVKGSVLWEMRTYS